MAEFGLLETTLIGLAVYTVVVWYVGYLGWRKTGKTVEDYVLGSRLFGTVALTSTIAATWFTAFFYYGAQGTYYWGGFTFLTNTWWQILLVVFYWTFGIRIWLVGKKHGFMTPADMLADYYQSKLVGVLVAIASIVFLYPYIQIQIVGGGIALDAISQGRLPNAYQWGAFLMFVTMLIYTVIGGVKSVVWTDIIQGVVLFGTLFIGAFIAVSAAGGLDTLFKTVAAKTPDLFIYPDHWFPRAEYGHALTFPIYFSFLIGFGIGGALQPPIWQRYYIFRSPKILRNTCLILAVFYVLACSTAPFIGTAGHILVPGLKPPQTDSVLPLMAAKHFPWYAVAVVIGVWAASMSTLDSQILSISSFVSRDIYQALINPKAAEQKLTQITKIMVVVFSIVAFVGALYRPPLITLMALIGVAALTNLLTPLIGATMWPRATREGAIAGLLAGIIGTALFQFVVPKAYVLGFFAGIWGLFFNIIAFFAVSYLTKPMPKEIQDRFHGLLASRLYKAALATREASRP